MASDEDLKLSDMLRYYMRDSEAAKVRGGPRTSSGLEVSVGRVGGLVHGIGPLVP